MKPRLSNLLIPVPLAAPETPALRRARISLIVAATLLGVSLLFFTTLMALLGRGALALPVGLLVFIAIQGPVWLRAKNRADDDFLFHGEIGRD